MDRIGVIGVSWRQGSPEALGRYVLPTPERPDLVRRLHAECETSELLYLATCNRVEIAFASDGKTPLREYRPRLFEALEEMFDNLGESEKLEAFFEVVGPKDRLPENTEIMTYRIIQEIVNNTLKHSGADSIDMTMVVQPEELNISYSDNGKGFDVEKVLKKKSMGLQNIQSRVDFMDGTMNIDSNGHGAFYRICIPLQSGSCQPAE